MSWMTSACCRLYRAAETSPTAHLQRLQDVRGAVDERVGVVEGDLGVQIGSAARGVAGVLGHRAVATSTA
jgi:hypothetical protein